MGCILITLQLEVILNRIIDMTVYELQVVCT